MIVTFYYRDDHALTQVEGTITMKDGVLVANPADSVALRNVLQSDVRVYRADDAVEILKAALHPAEFLKALPQQYHGSYFWCKQVED
jgi:hypothetical protein